MSAITEILSSSSTKEVDVWRPVKAERLHDNVYRIADQPHDPEIERWQWVVPGDIVVCELADSSNGSILAATGPYVG